MNRLTPQLISLCLVLSVFATPLFSQGLPTVSGQVHYDPLSGSNMVNISRGGSSVRITDSANGGVITGADLGPEPIGLDDLTQYASPWSFEMLFANYTTSAVFVPLVLTVGSRMISGTLKIDPPSGGGSGLEYFNIVIDEAAAGLFGGLDSSQSNFYVSITPPKRGLYEPSWIGFDVSVVEEIGAVELHSTNFNPHPVNFPLADALVVCIQLNPQTSGMDEPTGNMSLGINGLTPSAASFTHRVKVSATDSLDIELVSGVPNQPFILLAGSGLSPDTINLPWGGSIDLAAPSILLNGVNPNGFFDQIAKANFFISVPVGCSQAGTAGPGLQAIYPEAAAPPFFYRHTEAGQPVIPFNTKTHYTNLGDDDFVQHDLCGSFSYLGNPYSTLYICSNGQITFDQPSTLFSPTSTTFFNGFQAGNNPPNPGVAPVWADFNRGSTSGDWVTVQENLNTGVIVVDFINQSHWDSQQAAGSWSCTLGLQGPNSVQFNLSEFVPGIVQVDPDPICGVSDGISAGGGGNAIVDFSSLISNGPYTTPTGAAPESIMEQFPLAGNDPLAPFDIGTLSFTDPSGGGLWTIF